MELNKYMILIALDPAKNVLEKFCHLKNVSFQTINIHSVEDFTVAVASAHALLIDPAIKISEEIIAAAPLLKVIGLAGIDADNIDMEAATRRGVAVVNAPAGNITSAAEHTIAMMMSISRHIPQASASMKAKKWEKNRFLGRELKGRTLGIIGLGRVGAAVAAKVHGLQMKVLGCDPYVADERMEKLGVERTTLEELLERSDIITLHLPLTETTAGLMNADSLAKIKTGAMIINCSCSGTIDENALFEAIRSGAVAGAALDVFPTEPPVGHPLYDMDEVVLTPHLSSSTAEARANAEKEAIENIIQYLGSGSAANVVNVPAAPPEIFHKLEPFMDLSQRLGLLMSQVGQEPIEAVTVSIQGEKAGEGADLIAASFLKGLLTPVLSGNVNLVNAPTIARERGIRIATVRGADATDFTDLISVEIKGPWGGVCMAGTIFGKHQQRVVRYDEFKLDALPMGNLVLIFNDDVPGVIGRIGNCFGKNNINISRMYNGRDMIGGKAINLVNIDQEPTKEVLDQLLKLPNVVSVKAARLPES